MHLQELEEGDYDVENPILAESDWENEIATHILNNETNSNRSEHTDSANLSEDAASTSASLSDIQEKNKRRTNEQPKRTSSNKKIVRFSAGSVIQTRNYEVLEIWYKVYKSWPFTIR